MKLRNGFCVVYGLRIQAGCSFLFYIYLTNKNFYPKYTESEFLYFSWLLTKTNYNRIKKWVLLLSKVVRLEKDARFFFYFHNII